MGQEALGTAHANGKTSTGKLLLESEELVFRGDFRLVVAFRDVTEVHSGDGVLVLRSAAGEASFEIGPQADRWAEKIRHPRTLLDKLGVKPGHLVSVIDLVDEGFIHQLGERGARVVPGLVDDADLIFYYAPSVAALERLADLKARIRRNGAIWVVSPKGDRSIQDVHVMASAKAAGLVDTKVAKFSDTLTSLKLVIPVKDR